MRRREAPWNNREALSKGTKSPKKRELERENRQLRGAVAAGAIREVILKRELEAARGSHPTKPEKSRR